MKKNIKGFTLIEMVITIVIIIVLSSISVPIYKDYVRDAKLGVGHVLLSRIRDAQLRYYDEYGSSLLKWNQQSSATLYAYWTVASYIVRFDNQNGIGGTTQVTATYNATLPSIQTPVKEGYSFDG